MGKGGKRVYKYTGKGKLVEIYATVSVAIKREGTTRHYLQQAIEQHKPINNFVFSFDEPAKPPKKKVALVRDQPTDYPWEGSNGFFDIDAWARECIQP